MQGLGLTNRAGQWMIIAHPAAADRCCAICPICCPALRLLAAPLAAWAILAEHDSAALAVFAGAGLSDLADGFIARRWASPPRFGAWLDPIADKLLMLLCFLALYDSGRGAALAGGAGDRARRR